MKYRRTLLKTLAILGPMAAALSSPAYAYDDDWCSNYYNYYHDPRCADIYDYYPAPYGDFFFFGDDHRFHHRRPRHDDPRHDDPRHDDPRHGGFNHSGFGNGGFNHEGFGGRSPGPMFIPGSGGHRR